METKNGVCGKEAIEVLNCVTDSNYDQDKCILLLQSLRRCVISKKVKKFSLPDEKQQEGNQGSKAQN